jgi:phage gp29-like protein
VEKTQQGIGFCAAGWMFHVRFLQFFYSFLCSSGFYSAFYVCFVFRHWSAQAFRCFLLVLGLCVFLGRLFRLSCGFGSFLGWDAFGAGLGE